jgi:hypothetical protein
MTEPDKSDAEIMQEVMPGSTTFQARILCPCCGWHFKRGLTDPKGEHHALVPDMLVVCGQCLRCLRSDDQCQFMALDNAQINALPVQARMELAEMWQMAFVSLAVTGPEPKEPLQ